MTLIAPRWDEARSALSAAVAPLTATEIPVADCDRLILAADVLARTALPAFDTSAMDGWAAAGEGPWRVVGESLAGRPHLGQLQPGEINGELKSPEEMAKIIREQHKEIEYLKRQREILKKAMSILGEEPNPGMR